MSTAVCEPSAAASRVERGAVLVEGDDVAAPHEAGSHVACEQEMPGRLVVPHADMDKAVDDPLVVEDSIGEDELVDQCRVGGGWSHGVSARLVSANINSTCGKSSLT